MWTKNKEAYFIIFRLEGYTYYTKSYISGERKTAEYFSAEAVATALSRTEYLTRGNEGWKRENLGIYCSPATPVNIYKERVRYQNGDRIIYDKKNNCLIPQGEGVSDRRAVLGWKEVIAPGSEFVAVVAGITPYPGMKFYIGAKRSPAIITSVKTASEGIKGKILYSQFNYDETDAEISGKIISQTERFFIFIPSLNSRGIWLTDEEYSFLIIK